MGAYMGHMGAALGHACAHTGAIWEQQWGMHARIYGPYMGQPYKESREEGNNRESLPFLGPGKGITPGLSLPYFIPQRNLFPIPTILK